MDTLGSNEVHVWFSVPQQCHDHTETYLSWLDASERQRYARFRLDRDRHNYLVAHGLSRSCLSRYGERDPEAWRFSANAHGKLEIAAEQEMPLRFNLSRSMGLVACAVTRSADVGVDVEHVNRQADLTGIAQMSFTPTELADRAQLTGPAQKAHFFRLWTLKEAYLKALGLGLSRSLQSIEFRLAEGSGEIAFRSLREPERSSNWRFGLFSPTAEHCLAIAVQHDLSLQIQVGRAIPGVRFQPVPCPVLALSQGVAWAGAG
ncbi:MAG: 4'-phosphopantetheinyl transferase family protein [Elainellaceae cyanobacterium]